MPKVDLQRPLTVPTVPARSAASSIMHEIAEEKGEWADFSLYIKLAAIGLPDVGYVAIPVKIDTLSETTEPRHAITFRLRARRSPDAFPTFEGSLGIDGTGPSNSLLWMAGEYAVPLGGFGAVFNTTVAHGTAEQSLWNMLVELGDAIQARVERREMDVARYRLIFNTGD
jgi:hypothetical protein